MTETTFNEPLLAERRQLLEDGFCVIPGVLSGDFLKRVQDWADGFLDEHVVDPRLQYQGSDFHIYREAAHRAGELAKDAHWSPIVDELIAHPPAVAACERIGLEGQTSGGTVLILSKPAGGPALYWHQDFMNWNHPAAALPWPTWVFLSYYLVDTTVENGCLRAIPGTHRKRIPLHDQLPDAHGPEIQAAGPDHPCFQDHPDAVDVPVKAGDLVLCDGRVLHAAHPNNSNKRRTLLLMWNHTFPFPMVPSWWEGPRPVVMEEYEPGREYVPTRKPGRYLA